jgi:hypothetical protein
LLRKQIDLSMASAEHERFTAAQRGLQPEVYPLREQALLRFCDKLVKVR